MENMPDKLINKQLNKNQLEMPASSPAVWLTLRKPLIILAHTIAFAVSLLLSFLVVNEMKFKQTWLVGLYPTLLILFLIVKLPVFWLFRQYRGWWRYVGISDLLGMLRASLFR